MAQNESIPIPMPRIVMGMEDSITLIHIVTGMRNSTKGSFISFYVSVLQDTQTSWESQTMAGPLLLSDFSICPTI